MTQARPQAPSALHVFYDARCGFCRHCREWLEKQATYFPLDFVPYQSQRARELCPRLESYQPWKEIVVMSDTGAIYQGAHAWVMCLYATIAYRELSLRLAHPRLLPFARKACQLVSRNRFHLSSLLHLKPDDDLKRMLHETPEPDITCDFSPSQP